MFATAGRWLLRATQGRHSTRIAVAVLAAKPTPPPRAFGPLGARGCKPPSSRNPTETDFSHAEVFGTAVHGPFWGLFAFMPSPDSWASSDAAVFQNIIDKTIKIVFKFDDFPDAFYAIAPDGTHTAPVWGPEQHGSSNWERPGVEWGAGFMFTQPGCRRIHADAGSKAGEIWFEVRS